MSEDNETKEEDNISCSPPTPHPKDIDTTSLKNDLEKIPITENVNSIIIKIIDETNDYEEKLIENSEDLSYKDKSNENIEQEEEDKYNSISLRIEKKEQCSDNNKKLKLELNDNVNNETIKNNENKEENENKNVKKDIKCCCNCISKQKISNCCYYIKCRLTCLDIFDFQNDYDLEIS